MVNRSTEIHRKLLLPRTFSHHHFPAIATVQSMTLTTSFIFFVLSTGRRHRVEICCQPIDIQYCMFTSKRRAFHGGGFCQAKLGLTGHFNRDNLRNATDKRPEESVGNLLAEVKLHSICELEKTCLEN